MDFKTNNIIEEYLTETLDVFTTDDFYKHLKACGVKVTKADASEILHISEYVFSLVNNEFVTKAGVFTGRWFSFKPSREEVEKGCIIIGTKGQGIDGIVKHGENGFLCKARDESLADSLDV